MKYDDHRDYHEDHDRNHHRVDLFHWVENVIKKVTYWFTGKAEALYFADGCHHTHDAKVYNREGELVHECRKGCHEKHHHQFDDEDDSYA